MAWSILIPLFWSVTTIVSTRQLAATAAAPVRVQKKPAKLPASGKSAKLDVFLKRQCLEQLYELDTVQMDEDSDERKCKKIQEICRSCGMNRQYMEALRKKLPPGLVNDAEQKTLRRAVNHLCNIKGDRQRWTQAELKRAVLSTVNDGAPVGATLKQYGISKDCMNKHRTALMAHKKAGGTDDSYFAQDLTTGRPTLLSRDDEAICAAMLDLHGSTGIGKDYQRTKQYVAGLTEAKTQRKQGGSQSHVRGFKKRNRISAQAASDLSQIRAESLTPEKHHSVRSHRSFHRIAWSVRVSVRLIVHLFMSFHWCPLVFHWCPLVCVGADVYHIRRGPCQAA